MSTGKYLLYATIVSTFILIVWGAYTTAGDYGGACGVGGGSSASVISDHWPYCHGTLAFPTDWGGQVEYMHRVLSVIAGMFLFVTTAVVWKVKPRPTGAARGLLLTSLLIIVQILLGNVVVNSELHPVITAIHLANATALFGTMVVSGVLLHLSEKKF